MNKRGSLNLSIQAIVILVMAMAVLGLGLGFIRTLMGQGQSQFEEAIANAKLKNPATADQPITVSQIIKVKKGKTTTFEVGVYNNGNAGNPVTLSLADGDQINCPVVITGETGFILESLDQDIPEGDASGFIVSLYTGKSLDITISSTFICSIEAGSLSKQFFIEVGT
ncbi:MAG: hypothetical protein ISS25_04800 [Nanoarchaeota archaeon]|nr:hypothetical protein [DPANN group archaeon]MBL7117119.1 hypothetical protein [Nanoarchaeota archaeon]